MSAEEPGYALRVTGPAERQLNRLPEGTAAAIVEFMLGALLGNPHRLGGQLRSTAYWPADGRPLGNRAAQRTSEKRYPSKSVASSARRGTA